MKVEEKRSGETAREYACRTIRDDIISLNLEPGSSSNDMEMSQHIDIGRIPARGATIQLSEESRIIEIFLQRGTRITLIDVELMGEARFLRLVLEKAVVEPVYDMADEEDLAWLGENIMLQELYTGRGLGGEFLDLGSEMHRKLFTIYKKELTYNMCQYLAVHYDRIRSPSMTMAKDYEIIEGHKELLRALEVRDKHPTVGTMDKHSNRWVTNERTLKVQCPQYFKRLEQVGVPLYDEGKYKTIP